MFHKKIIGFVKKKYRERTGQLSPTEIARQNQELDRQIRLEEQRKALREKQARLAKMQTRGGGALASIGGVIKRLDAYGSSGLPKRKKSMNVGDIFW